jgi:phage terminase large subunit-like protein
MKKRKRKQQTSHVREHRVSKKPDPSPADKAIRFLESLKVPEGRLAGKPVKLAQFQKQFIRGAFADGISIGVLSIGRGNGKTTLSAGLALGALLGEWDDQPKREIVIGAKTRQQGAIAFSFVQSFAEGLSDDVRRALTFRKSPRFEIEYEGPNGPHVLRVLASEAKNVLGLAPVFALLDERSAWNEERGADFERAILSGLGKRGGRALIISTSAPDDKHAFSRWLDQEQDGVYRQQHVPPPGLPADDVDSLIVANPGCEAGIGSSLDWLKGEASRAIARGGSSLSGFRNLNRNERIAAESRDMLISDDEWLKCEVDDLPPRQGPCCIGIDLGGSASMSAAAYFWYETGRLETLGWFSTKPALLDRGGHDGVGDRYLQMQQRGELSLMGDATVPPGPFIAEVFRYVEGQQVVCMLADRYRQSEIGEGIARAGVRVPVIWRGMGFRDGGEDCERFRRACLDGRVKSAPSLLLRSAIRDSVVVRDHANNLKLTKSRSLGRIDATSASVLAIAEGARRSARPAKRPLRYVWASGRE